jgi:hypothetical protein
VKRRFLWLAVAALALGLATLAYRGPGRAIMRGHVGDIGATMGVYALFGFTTWGLRARIAATLVIALAIELGQLAWSSFGRSGFGALTIGSVFDPWDLLAYVIGTALAVAWERTRRT